MNDDDEVYRPDRDDVANGQAARALAYVREHGPVTVDQVARELEADRLFSDPTSWMKTASRVLERLRVAGLLSYRKNGMKWSAKKPRRRRT